MISSSTLNRQQHLKQEFPSLKILRIFLLVNILALLCILLNFISIDQIINALGNSRRWQFAIGLGVCLNVVFILMFALTWTKLGEVFQYVVQFVMKKVAQYQWIVWAWFILSSFAYSWLLFGPFGYLFKSSLVRACLLWPLVAISSILFQSLWSEREFWQVFAATALWYGAIYEIIVLLSNISSYPFTLSWSEGSSYYYASLFLSEKIYGLEVSLPIGNPTRHLLQAIPFLIYGLPIWVHRLWEVILWLVISGITIALLVRRLELRENLIRWAYFAWIFLYLFQGPIFYFLLVSLIPVLWGFNSKRFKKSLALVLIGSVWAGVSRVNWLPIPGLLAAALYFLEEEIDGRTWFRYILNPVIWVVMGTMAALIGWYGYAALSGNSIGQFGVYFSSNLLWYRLLPNPTFREGVLPMAILVSLPILGLMAIRLYKSGDNLHIIRRLGIGAILLVLFITGLIVSTKIGGGNNIHNLDAYLFILLVVGSYIYFDKISPDYAIFEKDTHHTITKGFIALGILIPIMFALQQGKPVSVPMPTNTEKALKTVQEFASQATSRDGKVLFIAERQLLTLDIIEGVPLVPDYERMTLMEMAMGGNEAYLNEFSQRIANQEFALIISEPLKINYKGKSKQFGEENDVYVHWVSEPVLCYYEPVKTISKIPLQLLMPRSEPGVCP